MPVKTGINGGIRGRIRGFKAVSFCATLKAVGLNIFRATAVRKAVNNGKAAHGGILPSLMHAIYVVKEHFLMACSQLRRIFTPFGRRYGDGLIMAP